MKTPVYVMSEQQACSSAGFLHNVAQMKIALTIVKVPFHRSSIQWLCRAVVTSDVTGRIGIIQRRPKPGQLK